MTLNASTLRPGLLVSLKTSLRGNINYQTQELETDHTTETGQRRARWETTRTVYDPAEHEAAVKARGKARSLLTSVCAQSAFGLLCREDRAADLERAVSDAREVVEAFNRSARLTTIGLYVIVGRVAADDVEAVRAINSEVRDLVQDMEAGIKSLDVKAVRDAANKARSIGQMLTPEAQASVQEAIEAARTVARAIVKAGETAAAEIDERALATLAEARTAFLDLDDMPGVERGIIEPVAEARAIDLDLFSDPEPTAYAPAAISYDY